MRRAPRALLELSHDTVASASVHASLLETLPHLATPSDRSPPCLARPSPVRQSVEAGQELHELWRDYGGRADVRDAVALETLAETAAEVRSEGGGRVRPCARLQGPRQATRPNNKATNTATTLLRGQQPRAG